MSDAAHAVPRDAVHVSLERDPSPDDAAVIFRGLAAFNERHAGPSERVSLAVFVRDATGAVRGGLTATIKFGWIHVDWLWLPDDLRGLRLGSAVMDAAEEEARRRGCIGATLETTDYQARGFYEKRGYAVFGTLENFPVGSRSYYLSKALAPST